MRILIIGEVFYPEDFLINELALDWQKKGHTVEVLTRTPSYPKDEVFKGYKNKLFQINYFNNIKIYRFPVILGYQSSTIKKILNYINFVLLGSIIAFFIGKKYDHVFIFQTGPLTLAFPGILLKKFYSKKVTIWTQDVWPDSVYAYGFKKTKLLEAILNKIVRVVYSNVDNILISCQGFANIINKYADNKKITWIPNWSMVKYDYSLIDNKNSKGFNFTFAGNIGKVQNLENVINAFGKVSNKYENVFLNIVGDGSNLEKLKEIAEEFKIKNVIFHGRQPLESMSNYFNSSDVLLISLTSAEIFKLTIPSKFQSYLQSGKPIMGVIEGELKELILEYNLGKVANPDNIDEISNTFESFILAKEKDLETMGKNALQINNEMFNCDIIKNKISSILLN